MNAIHVIEPHRSEAGIWEFSDKARELKREPFVGEANEVLDYMTRDIPLAHHGVAVTFARQPFPGYSFHFTFVQHCKECPGTWYRLREDLRDSGGPERLFAAGAQPDVWLCPVLLQYFERAPRHLLRCRQGDAPCCQSGLAAESHTGFSPERASCAAGMNSCALI